MTGTIDILLHANHPDEPLPKHYVFRGSPSCPRILNVPEKVGLWEIGDVYISVTLPDGTMHTVDTTCTDGTYVATIPACDVVGVVEGGFQVVCNGTDETGEEFEGLCLGCGDLEVLPRIGQIHVGETVHFFRIVDTVPATPQRYDTAVIDGAWMWYDGTEWLPFGVVAPVEIDTTLSHAGQAADAKATGDALAKKADEFTEWAFNGDVKGGSVYSVEEQNIGTAVSYRLYEDGVYISYQELDSGATTVVFDTGIGKSITATRKRVLLLGRAVDEKRPLTDNTCHRTEFSEWVPGDDLPDGITMVGQPTVRTLEPKVFVWLDSNGKEWWSNRLAEFDLTEDTFNPVEEQHPTPFTATRSAVCTEDKKFVTEDVVDGKVSDAVSTNNPAFVSAVEEIISRQNNAQ